MEEYAAVILTGGTGRRLGHMDKAQLIVDGRTMLESALVAVAEAAEIVIVGPRIDLPRSATTRGLKVSFTTEDPPLGGPAAGLLAGRAALSMEHDLLVVLAVDMPGVNGATVQRLLAAHDELRADGAFLHDPGGRRQLAGVLDVRRLDEIRPSWDEVPGLPIHRLFAPLRLAAVSGDPSESRDVDSPDDLPR